MHKDKTSGRRIGLGGAIAALALVATLGIAAPANAAAPAGCTTLGYTCIWKDSNNRTDGSTSARVRWQLYIPNLGTWTYGSTNFNAANSASSVYNNGNAERVYLYNNVNKQGFATSYGVQQGSSDLFWSGYNDNFESGYYASYNE